MVWKALPRLQIAVPCHQDWNAMPGDARVRFCGQCCQNVYDVRHLRAREVAALIEAHGERMPCLRLFRRPDGTVVTRSCLEWLRTGVRVVRWSAWSVAALAVGFWMQVWLWHERLHPDSTIAPAHQERPKPAIRVAPLRDWEPPVPIMGDPGATPRPPRPQPRPPVSEGEVNATIKALSRRLDLALFPTSGRLITAVTVRPNGRVVRVRIESTPELTVAARHELEKVVRATHFPRNDEEYQTEFTMIFQRP